MRFRTLVSGLAVAALTAAGLMVFAPSSQAAIIGTPTTLVSQASGRCLDVEGNSTANGQRVIVWDCHGGQNQNWTLTTAGEVRVWSGADVKCLDVEGAGTTAGSRLLQWSCHGGQNQKFTLQADGHLQGVQSGLCVDVTGGGNSPNGTAVILWNCGTGSNQIWTQGGGTTPPPPPPGTAGNRLMGYFVDWGIYGRAYQPKNIVTSGSISKLNYINFAFGNVLGGQCTIGDAYADYDKAYTAAESVDGVADTWDQPVRGIINQFRKLKRINPNLKIIWSFGGWTWSGGFPQAAANPTAFANSCYNIVEDPRWADVFDGIDLDWEYPNACGLSCDTSGPAPFRNMLQAMRARFGSGLVTAAITADGTSGGKMDKADYAGAAQYVDWYNVMTYDFFGGWDAAGPTAPHSPLTAIPGNALSAAGFNTDAALDKLRGKGIPSNKLLIGIGFYGRGWQGVTQAAPGGSASAPAPGTYEAGVEDYKVIKTRCPATSTVAGTAYGFCGGQWWGYDTPATIGGKMSYAKTNGLGGAFFWELTGDTTNGELITAMRGGL